MPATRVLLVDDEPVVLRVLRMHLTNRGYDVTSASSVAEALSEVANRQFDVLIADLNIGQPGDGFTVVSAMRRTQPDAITIILTGYPDFETALNAIRNQVDDYITKPPDIKKLISRIETLRQGGRSVARSTGRARVSEIIEKSKAQITQDWLNMTAERPNLSVQGLPPEERVDHIPDLLGRLVAFLRSDRESAASDDLALAREHGKLRRIQGYSLPMVLEETRVLEKALFQSLQANLLSADLSSLVPDMIRISDALHAQIAASVEGYLSE